MNLLKITQLSLVLGKAKTTHGSDQVRPKGEKRSWSLAMTVSFVPQIFSIQNLVSSKQNPRILKGDKNYWMPVGDNNVADIETRAEPNVREGQPSAD